MGLNLPGFIERSQVISSLPSLGLLTLGGLTKEFNAPLPASQQFAMEYREVPEVDAFDLDAATYDLVAISSFSAKIKDAYWLADQFRARGVYVVMGGLHVSVEPDEARQHADTIVIGEAEVHWKDFLHDFNAGRALPVYDCRHTTFDLALAPMPAFELLDISKYNRLTVQTQRGCPWRCSFCASTILLNPQFRSKPVEKVVAEIRRIQELWPDPFIEFADDNTFADIEAGKALLRALIPLRIRWFTETDISVADDEELLHLLRQSGCAQILIGLESPKREFLFSVNNWKQSRFDKALDNVRRIQSFGITVNGCFILGLDNSDVGYFDDVEAFVKEANLFEVQITVLTPFPGTPLYSSLLKRGRILEPGAWEKCTLFDINFVPNKMSVEELRKGLISLGQKIYDPVEVKRRRRQFFETIRPEYRREHV